MSQYSITASPLHGLTRKARAFPKPWIKGKQYDLSFESLRSAIQYCTQPTFCIRKTAHTKTLFIEVDASDAYQMVLPWTGDPEEEGRGRQGDTGARMVIQWTSKASTAFELKLPDSLLQRVFSKALSTREVPKPHRDEHHRWHHAIHRPQAWVV
jgi:hypothetical protein